MISMQDSSQVEYKNSSQSMKRFTHNGNRMRCIPIQKKTLQVEAAKTATTSNNQERFQTIHMTKPPTEHCLPKIRCNRSHDYVYSAESYQQSVESYQQRNGKERFQIMHMTKPPAEHCLPNVRYNQSQACSAELYKRRVELYQPRDEEEIMHAMKPPTEHCLPNVRYNQSQACSGELYQQRDEEEIMHAMKPPTKHCLPNIRCNRSHDHVRSLESYQWSGESYQRRKEEGRFQIMHMTKPPTEHCLPNVSSADTIRAYAEGNHLAQSSETITSRRFQWRI